MCMYCGTDDDKREASARDKRVAELLKRLANHYDAVALGRIKPHGDRKAWDGAAVLARSVLRSLVEDWV